MKTIFAKLRVLFTGRVALAKDLRDEMRTHLEFEVERRIDQGMTQEEARLAATREFGNSTLIEEQTRDAWGLQWVDQFRQDLAYGARTLRRAPGFTFSAVAVLALGIGVNLAIIHIFNAVIYHRLSVPNAESIIAFERSGRFPYRMTEYFRQHNTVFSYVIAERTGASAFLDDDPEPERSTFVSGSYFSALGVNPSRGRLLEARDAQPDAPPVVVLSYRYWERRFGADPGVVGGIVRLNGKPIQIVGIAASNFTGLSSRSTSEQAALWFPMTAHPYLFPGSQILSSFSQRDTEMYTALKPGVPLDAANAQLTLLVTELQKEHPNEIEMKPPEAATGRPLLYVGPDALAPIILVMLLFLLVLVTACANLGNLLLARGHARRREISIRLAVGAGASRIVRQLMVENLLLAALGATTGLGIGYFAAKALLYLIGAPPDLSVVTDWRVVIATCALAAFSAAVFGLAPARQAVRRTLLTSTRAAATRTRQFLIGVQVSVSCFLLVLATLLAGSVQRQLTPDDVRFDYRSMVVVDPQLHAHNLTAPAARLALDDMALRLNRLQGVTNVTTALSPPFGGRLFVDSRPGQPRISYNEVEPSYFALMNLPVMRGRLFFSNEQAVVVLSEAAAINIWPGEDPIGKSLDVSQFSTAAIETGRTEIRGTEKRTVVGVVKDSGASVGKTVEGYMPLKDADLGKALLLVSASGDPAGVAREARAAATLPRLSPSAWLVRTALDRERARQRGAVRGVGSLSATATLLAAIGIFGLVAFTVAQRTREIGIRIALGARRRNVLATLLEPYALAMGTGALAGTMLAGAVARVLESQVFGVRALDPVSYVGALTMFAAVALVAVLIPARRALRIDPASALRWE